jgi:putative phage-type endonuclease
MSRAEWLQERKTCIGGSDAAAILGYSHYRTALDVYADKVSDEPSDHDNKVLRFGRDVEAAIANLYEYETGREVMDLGGTLITRHPDMPWLGVTLDRVTAEIGEIIVSNPLQLKHVSRFDCTAEEYKIDPILEHQIQVQLEIFCTQEEWGALGAMFPGYQLVEVDMGLNERFIDSALPKFEAFWRCVENREPPPVQSERDLKAIKQIWHKSTPKLISLPSDVTRIVDSWLAHKADRLEAEEKIEHCEAQLIEKMKDATTGQIQGGGFLTLKTTKKKGHTVPPSEFRQLRYKKGF